MTRVLTPEQVARFDTDGYVFPVDCLSRGEAADYRARFDAYERESGASARSQLRVKAHLGFPWLTELVRDARILGAVEDVIGPDILLYLSTLWFKGPEDGNFVSWHQDSVYYGLEPHDEVTVWLAFTEATVENGCVRVLGGTHRGPDLHHVETRDPANLLSRGQTIENVDETGAVDMILSPGQFSMHHERLVHGSNPNRSTDRRMGMSMIFVPAHVRCALGRRPAMLVQGEDRFGHWDADPEPRFDLDPVCLDHIAYCTNGYRGEGG